ncbi:MAG: hypothetical protein U1C57_02900, partial [Candidatus Doudnabacteria bacterium]|nr:hypothetical protein [Candidatus Doudnabacteria bacterium]
IAEIDDIRCTLIKRTRVGRDYKSKFLQRPIKLAWQTANGYAESGAGDYYKTDMANVMKSFAGQAIKDLVGDFGGDIGDFEGDLSSASFSDIATLLGQSLFSEIINSKGTNLAGYQFGDTLEKLGGMYFADFLGLPRQMFSEGHRYDTYEELAGAIGAAAIEKRLDVPIGTFDGGNLREMLQKSGQHKFEYEMNLDRDSLDNYFKDVNSATSVENKDYLIGKAVIEKNLQLQKGSFTGKNNRPPENFSEVKDSIGKVKAEIMFKDGAYVDNALHIDLGTTDLLIKGSISPYTFAVNVGRTRLDDTAYGLQYMAARDASYELDQGAQNPDGTFQRGTFERVLDGDKTALETIGIKIMSKVFATDNSSEQRAALEQWIRTNLAKNPDDKEACQFETPVKQTIETGTPPKAKEVTITETKASSVGLHSGDLFSLLGCPDSNPHSIFQKIGSKIISDALIQQYLTPEAKFRFNLTDVNPQFHSSDPEKQFYVVRAYKIPTLLDEIKGKWNGNNKDPEYQRMKAAIDSAYGTITGLFTNSMPVVSIDQAKQTARNVSVAINKMNSDIQGLKAGSNRYIDDANWTLFKLSELSRTIAEIMAGKPLPSTDTVTINKIPDNLFSLHGDNGEANTPSVNQSSSGRSNGSSGFTTSSGFAPNKTTLMALFSRKIKPAEFFLALASDKVETSLELPQNSLIYFVQNYEKKGLGTIDSFYTAIGQAKLEEAFNMPAQYFQGSFITDAALEKPDFRNDMRALLIYGDSDINAIAPPPITVTSAKGPTKAQAALNEVTLTPGTQLRNPLYERWITPPTNFDNINSDGTVDTSGLTPEQIADVQKIVDEEHYIAELAWLKILDRPTFDYLVARAEKRYKDQIQQFIAGLNISNKDLETSVDDLIENIRVRNLNDKIRTPDQDLLFRMGLSGSLDALASDNAVAWAGASTRANQIDKMLGISQGSTRALFTGKRNGWGSGQDRISKKDKQILVAKMGISPVAIEKLISYLDGEIPLRELEAIADDITPTGDNPYLESQSADNCDAASLSEVAGNLISNNIVQKGWFYFDKDIDKREKTRGTKEEFESYRSSAQNKATYIWEIAYGIGKLAGIDTERLVPQVESFLRGEIDSAINLEGDGPAKLEKAMGVSLGSLEKLFVKAEATDVGKPLVSYKKAVGHSVAKKLITGKLFSGLGVRIDPDLFSGNELFELMHGNFSSLWSIAGSMMDQSLGLPKGSVIALLTSRTSTMRLCALGEIGGSIIGRYIGLDYVSLKGNVFHNIGRSKIEKTLGIPQNSFSGANIDDLIKNIGPVNFYIAFNYPVGNVDLSPALNAFFDPAYVSSIDGFSKDFKLKKIRDFVSIFSGSGLTGDRQTAYEKLKTDLTSRVKDTARLALPVSADIPADSAWHGAWRKGEFGGENKDEVEKFISRIDGIDDSFGLDKGVTAKLLAGFYVDEFLTHTAACGIKDVSAKDASTPTFQEENDPDNGSRKHWEGCTDSVRNKDGQPFGNGPGNDWITFTAKNKDGNDQEYKLRAPDGSCDCDPVANPRLELEYYKTTSVVTPDVYLKKISVKTLGALAAYGAMDLFDFDLSDAQKTAVVGLLTHYSNWSKDSSGRMKIYNSLSAVFSLHLDNKAGLSEGTIGRLIENPQNAAGILLPEAARRLDGALGMNSAKKWSFTGIYARYINIQPSLPRITNPNLPQIPPADQTECGAEQAEFDTKEIGFRERQNEIDDWITENSNSFELAVVGGGGTSGAGGYSLTNHPLYVTKVLEPQVALNRDRNAAQAVVNLCKSGNRGGSGDLKEFPAGEARVKGFGDDCDNLKATGYIKSFLEAQCQIKENVSWALAWNWASDYASDEIHDQIWEATKQTIDMPATDIKRFFVNGDMRYFQAALMTYSANTFIDQKISRSDSQAVPEAFRTSYDMYKAWFVGIPEAEDYAADAAATQFFHPEADTRDFEETKGPNAYGDVYHRFGGNGSLIGIISDPDFHTNNPGTYRSPTTADLTAFSHQQTNLTYGQLDGSHTGSQIARSQSDAASCRDEQLTHVLNSPGNSGEEKVKNAYASTTVVEGYSIGDQMRACDYLISEDVELQNTMQSARDRVRDSFRKQVQFRMLDASLWSKD